VSEKRSASACGNAEQEFNLSLKAREIKQLLDSKKSETSGIKCWHRKPLLATAEVVIGRKVA